MSWASHLDGMYLGQSDAPQTVAEAAPESGTELISPQGNEVATAPVGGKELRILGLPITPILVVAVAGLITYLALKNRK